VSTYFEAFDQCEQPLLIKTQCEVKPPEGVLKVYLRKHCTYGEVIQVSSLKSETRK
jgi:hypothetical protein